VDRFCGSFKLSAPDGTPIAHDRCWMALSLEANEGQNGREIVIERPDGRRLTAERSRIARDLHDGVLQDLAAVVQGLEAAHVEQKARAGGRDIEFHQEVDALRHAASKLGRAVYDLRSEKAPSFLSAVESLVEVNLQRDPDCKVRLEVQDDFPQEIPDETGTELLRIVQEALTNARRHSGARNVRVSLEVDGADALVAEVADDGRGFDPASANGGVGIEGMREWASLLGGYMVACSETGEGTSVRVRVPEL
jgi:signal transduction histidine kinase